MPFLCLFCEKERCYISNFCEKCRQQKHLKLLYGNRYDEIVTEVLLRAEDKQQYKIKGLIKQDIDSRKNKISVGDETYMKK